MSSVLFRSTVENIFGNVLGINKGESVSCAGEEGDQEEEGEEEDEEGDEGEEKAKPPPKSTWKPPPKVPTEKPKIGANKKTYFVCNQRE